MKKYIGVIIICLVLMSLYYKKYSLEQESESLQRRNKLESNVVSKKPAIYVPPTTNFKKVTSNSNYKEKLIDNDSIGTDTNSYHTNDFKNYSHVNSYIKPQSSYRKYDNTNFVYKHNNKYDHDTYNHEGEKKYHQVPYKYSQPKIIYVQSQKDNNNIVNKKQYTPTNNNVIKKEEPVILKTPTTYVNNKQSCMELQSCK